MSSSAEAITVPMAYLAVDHQGGGMHMNQAAWGLLIATREFHNKNNKNAVSDKDYQVLQHVVWDERLWFSPNEHISDLPSLDSCGFPSSFLPWIIL